MSEYAERDILKQGNYYMRHVAAMTDFLDHWAQSSDANANLVAQETLITEATEALWEALELLLDFVSDPVISDTLNRAAEAIAKATQEPRK